MNLIFNKSIKIKELNEKQEIVFYVDSFFDHMTKNIGYGLLLVINNRVIIKDLGLACMHSVNFSKNILGEIMGVIKATNIAFVNSYKEITIFHNSLGIEKWITNEWSIKDQVVMKYKKIIKNRIKYMKINFKIININANAYRKEKYGDGHLKLIYEVRSLAKFASKTSRIQL